MKPHANEAVQKKFILSIILTALILVAEVVGGIWTGSLALLSDSAHVFMDIFALALSYLALRLSALPADDQHTYGWHRLEVLAALVNGLTLLVIGLGIAYEAVERFINPRPVMGLEMLIIAVLGLIVNLVVAFVLNSHEAHHDLNVRSAFLHVVGDAISSIGVIAAAIILWLTGWTPADPLVSLGIAALILVSAVRLLRSSLHILVEGTPEGLSPKEIAAEMGTVPGVVSIHDFHIWNICSGHISLSAHIVTDSHRAENTVLTDLKNLLAARFGIDHSTLQVEPSPCDHDEGGCGRSLESVPLQK